MNGLSDLHVHTDFSDGSESPEVVLANANRHGIRDLALTDHDTTHWLTESCTDLFFRAGTLGIALIRGVEVSARDAATGKKAHILGYWPGCEPFIPTHLTPFCDTIRQRRNEAAMRQVSILQNLGYPITEQDIWDESRSGQVYKQHILKALFRKGLASGPADLFYRSHFGKGGDCWYEIEYVPAADVVAAIRADGGFPVLAHPGQQRNYEAVPPLVEAGLMGIEYRHPSHSEEARSQIFALSEKYCLFRTAGSDYHGTLQPGRSLGAFPLTPEERRELSYVGFLK